MIAPPPPPALDSLLAGTSLIAGMGAVTVIPDLDFETYSEAGHVWNEGGQKWDCLPGATKKGLIVVGAATYAEHPSTEVLSLYYDLKDGRGRRFWCPGMPNPADLFYVAATGLLEAWNVSFERWIWNKVCVAKYGWPPLDLEHTRCAMAKARAYALPGALEGAGKVLRLANPKDAEGARLIKKFCMPRKPGKADPRRRIRPEDDPLDAAKLYAYNERDIVAEAEASALCPDLEDEELEFWLCDQRINMRGVQVDIESIEACIAILEQAFERYNAELREITGSVVERASELEKLQAWLAQRKVFMDSMDEDAIDEMLKNTWLDRGSRRALEIRQTIGSAAVKKVYAMRNQVTCAGRLHDLFSYHAARTGRATGNGPQPTNLPNSGPPAVLCGSCNHHAGVHHTACPWCGIPHPPGKESIPEWVAAAAQDVIILARTRDLDTLEYFFGAALPAISGALRGLFIAAPGYDLVCSDYSAIEAVALAWLAGEEWRKEVFRTHGKIYEMAASKITGIPFSEYERHKRETGSHHPTRKAIGKIAELASGYQGWVGAWKHFGADEYFTDEEIEDKVRKWRADSPAIVDVWKRVENAFITAVQNPGRRFEVRGMTFEMRGSVLYLRLLSGRYLHYHAPELRPNIKRGGLAISYMGSNTNPKNGPVGWIRMDTWGGRLMENITQATCRDILRHAIVNLERAGYPVVLHVYDEIVCEIPESWGSVEEFERIMSTMPAWAADWPVHASGGWRAKRYSK